MLYGKKQREGYAGTVCCVGCVIDPGGADRMDEEGASGRLIERSLCELKSAGMFSRHCSVLFCLFFSVHHQHFFDPLQRPVDGVPVDHQRRCKPDDVFVSFLGENACCLERFAEAAGASGFFL